MRTLALDVGTKTIGVAVSDEHGITANGITTIRRKNIKSDLNLLGKFVDQYNPSELLVGIPYNIDRSVSNRGKEILRFALSLKKRFSIPVKFWDESFSTTEAERALIEADMSRKKRKKVIDKMAAVLILQGYLENKRDTKQEG